MNVHGSEVDGAGVIEYSTTSITIITALLALLIGVDRSWTAEIE